MKGWESVEREEIKQSLLWHNNNPNWKNFQTTTLSQTSPGFYVSARQVFWKHRGKGDIARNEQFLHFPQCFLPIWRNFCHLQQIWNCCLQMLSVLKNLKFVIWKSAEREDFFLEKVENIVGKAVNTDNKHFPHFPQWKQVHVCMFFIHNLFKRLLS